MSHDNWNQCGGDDPHRSYFKDYDYDDEVYFSGRWSDTKASDVAIENLSYVINSQHPELIDDFKILLASLNEKNQKLADIYNVFSKEIVYEINNLHT